MKIEYSYGLLGYITRYAGGVVMALMLIVFVCLIYGIVSTKYYYEKPPESAFLLVISVFMTLFCYKGSIYLIKYSKSFTDKYLVTEQDIVVNPGDSGSTKYSWNNLDRIVYKRALKVFEIVFTNGKCLVLMNNGTSETRDFLQLKDFLLSEKFNAEKRWF